MLGGDLGRLRLLGLQLGDLELQLADPPFISRRWVCCWSDDWRIAATAARWKVASGFDSSADENCLNSFSRDSFSSSATAARTWCWTAVLDSEPKWRASTRVTCPLSGPKACSSCVLSSATTASDVCAEALLDLARRVLEVLLEHLDGGAGVLAVEHPGADLDRVGDHPLRVLARVDPRPHELGRDGVVDHQVLDDHPPEQGGHAGRAQGGGCGFHVGRTKATASPTTTTAGVRRSFAQALGSSSGDLEILDRGVAGPQG